MRGTPRYHADVGKRQARPAHSHRGAPPGSPGRRGPRYSPFCTTPFHQRRAGAQRYAVPTSGNLVPHGGGCWEAFTHSSEKLKSAHDSPCHLKPVLSMKHKPIGQGGTMFKFETGIGLVLTFGSSAAFIFNVPFAPYVPVIGVVIGILIITVAVVLKWRKQRVASFARTRASDLTRTLGVLDAKFETPALAHRIDASVKRIDSLLTIHAMRFYDECEEIGKLMQSGSHRNLRRKMKRAGVRLSQHAQALSSHIEPLSANTRLFAQGVASIVQSDSGQGIEYTEMDISEAKRMMKSTYKRIDMIEMIIDTINNQYLSEIDNLQTDFTNGLIGFRDSLIKLNENILLLHQAASNAVHGSKAG
jgi:hypothetical protein